MNESRIASVMNKIAAGKVSRAAAAEQLQVDVRTINRWMRKRGVSRPRSRYSKELEARARRREAKLRAAQGVINGQNTMQGAANDAGVTLRTMERWVEKAQKEAEKAVKQRKTRKNSAKTKKN